MPFQIENTATLLAVVNHVAQRVGFAGSIADAAGATDTGVIRMVAAANDAAKELAGLYAWPELIRSYSISVQADFPGQAEKGYDLPEDFFAFIFQTENSATTRMPAIGPLLPRTWQTIKTIAPYVSIRLMWRYFNGKIYFLNPPSSAQSFTLEYLSQGYVKDADDPTTFKNVASKNGDIFIGFDEYVLKCLARVKWLEMMQFDASAATNDFNRAFDSRVARLDGAPVLSMKKDGLYPPFVPIGAHSVPITGIGS